MKHGKHTYIMVSLVQLLLAALYLYTPDETMFFAEPFYTFIAVILTIHTTLVVIFTAKYGEFCNISRNIKDAIANAFPFNIIMLVISVTSTTVYIGMYWGVVITIVMLTNAYLFEQERIK